MTLSNLGTPDLTCVNCHGPLASDSYFCERCGTPVPSLPVLPIDSTRRDRSAPPEPFGGHPPPMEAEAPNATYLGNRLTYSDYGTNFDPLANVEYQQSLRGQFLATFAAWVIISVALAIITSVVTILATAFSAQSAESLSSLADASAVGALLLLLSSAAWGIATLLLVIPFLIRPLSVQLTEWMITVDGEGRLADAALGHMYSTIRSRQTPIGAMRVVRLSPERQQTRSYLRIDDSVFTGFVSSFAYGTDLFIGWSFWLNMSPARWMWLSVRRLFRGDSAAIYASLIHDRPKAMREVLHAAVRQGVDLANGQVRPLGQGGFGPDVRITDVRL